MAAEGKCEETTHVNPPAHRGMIRVVVQCSKQHSETTADLRPGYVGDAIVSLVRQKQSRRLHPLAPKQIT